MTAIFLRDFSTEICQEESKQKPNLQEQGAQPIDPNLNKKGGAQ
jgi:hypothetical protein